MKRYIVVFVLVLAVCGVLQAADLFEDFESYTNTAGLLGVWSERNPTVVTLGLETTEAYDGTQSMVVDYNCHNSPYWSEAYNIFDTEEDWSAYNTLNVWVKGSDVNQSLEHLYAVIYSAKDGVANPADHSELSMLGKVTVYRVTQVVDWTCLRFNLAQNFEILSNVRAIGIGIKPEYYGTGVIEIDGISLDETGYGGVLNNFEQYADTNELQACPMLGTTGNSALSLEANDANFIFEGEQSLKFVFDNGADPWYSKVSFKLPENLQYNWSYFNGGADYKPLTINFKIVDGDGKLQVVLIGSDSNVKATYLYDNGTRVVPGDWIRWDINPQTVYDDPQSTWTELDSIMRVEVQFVPIDGNDYGAGLVYLDDVHVNNCGEGSGTVGVLHADFNEDCVIDFVDFADFAAYWLDDNCASSNDCDGKDFPIGGSTDGTVNYKDLAVVLSDWLKCNMLFLGDCF